jgi:AraC family transcriptional regulator of adaptative response/methylated-DNA-[protein]-cysteine methyltransferase
MCAPPSKIGNENILKASWIDTLLGPMLAISDEQALYLLEFVDRRGLEREVERLRKRTKSAIIPGYTKPIETIETELHQYFEGKIHEFRTPLFLLGSPFQKQVWEELKKIPPGETRSYSDIAKAIGKPSAFRAVAQANGANQLALIIPCHRVINADGELGGYGGGLIRKKWLLNHEKKFD